MIRRSACLIATLLFATSLAQTQDDPPVLTVEHPECTFFGANKNKVAAATLGSLTDDVVARMPAADSFEGIPGGTRTNTGQHSAQRGTIDRYIFQAIQDAGATAAPKTTDYEFIRRVTLDLTGRIPTPERVLSFAADTTG